LIEDKAVSDQLHGQTIVDDEHLKLLSLGYTISAAITAFFGVFGLMYMAMGTFIASTVSRMPQNIPNNNQPPPAFIGWIFGAIGLFIFLLMEALAGLKLCAAFCLKGRKGRTFCMVVGALCCLGVPYGTVLGAFTFIVLGRDSVQRQFDQSLASPNIR
jgi:hypothetical protein